MACSMTLQAISNLLLGTDKSKESINQEVEEGAQPLHCTEYSITGLHPAKGNLSNLGLASTLTILPSSMLVNEANSMLPNALLEAPISSYNVNVFSYDGNHREMGVRLITSSIGIVHDESRSLNQGNFQNLTSTLKQLRSFHLS